MNQKTARDVAGAALAGLVLGVAVRLVLPDVDWGKLPVRVFGLDVCAWVGILGGVVVGWRRPAWTPRLLVSGLLLLALRMMLVVPGRTAWSLATLAPCAVVALGVGRLLGPRWQQSRLRVHRGSHVLAAAVPAMASVVVYSVWSITRHERFGSGSWDMGCYIHNAWLFAHGHAFSPAAVSSVLGDAAFWGGTNHFMPSLVLTAPLAWFMEATGTTWALLAAQAALIAAVPFPLMWLARSQGVSPLTTAALALAFVFHVSTQAAANFDVHEIVPVPLCLLLVLVAVERRRRLLLYGSLLVLVFTKESALLYGASVGMLLLLLRPGFRTEGAVITFVCTALFFVVTGVIQPALLEDNSRGMIHVARFAGLGSSLGEVAANIVLHPGTALATLFVPSSTKAATWMVSAGGFGFLPLFSGEAFVLAAPNLVERFLSDKREMWGLAFHYGLVTAGCAAWGALRVLAELRRRLSGALTDGAFDIAGAVFLIAALFLAAMASPAAPELSSLEKSYFATEAEAARYRRARQLVGRDASVVAQNHFLPHLALREHIWQPEARFIERADVIVLDPAASPWPHSAAHVRALVVRLLADPRRTLIFSEGTTVVFGRRGSPVGSTAEEATAVEPTPDLLQSVGAASGLPFRTTPPS